MAQPAATPKVEKEKKEKKEKKDKRARIDFLKSPAAKDILDDKGRINELPGDRLDHKLHLTPRKNDFSSESLYLLFRAGELEESAQEYMDKASSMRKEAEALKNSPDPALRGQLKRLARLKEQQAALEELLKKEGITI